MSESRRPAAGRKKFVVQKQKTPTWIVGAFIGVPCLVIVILLGVLLSNMLGGSRVPAEEKPDMTEEIQRADSLFDQGKEQKKIALEAREKGDELTCRQRLKSALAAFRESFGLYAAFIEEIRNQNNGEVPEIYMGYLKKQSDIQQHIADTTRMFGLL